MMQACNPAVLFVILFYFSLTSLLKQCEFVWLHCKQIHQLLFCLIPDKVAAQGVFAAFRIVAFLISNHQLSPITMCHQGNQD